MFEGNRESTRDGRGQMNNENRGYDATARARENPGTMRKTGIASNTGASRTSATGAHASGSRGAVSVPRLGRTGHTPDSP
jgi:hypothetical protein